MEKNRSSFTGKLGFVLAAAGSAVGLGNIWRFPYLAANYGGGMFLLTYVVLALTFGFVLMVAEISIGRKTGLSAIGAYKALDKRFSFIGYLGALVPMIILPYYSVIGGWVSKYLAVYVSGHGTAAVNDSYFSGFISKIGEPIFWFALFVGLTFLAVLLGVEKGIEKVSKIMMPVLVVLAVGIAVYSMFLPGAMDGVLYYITPNFANFSIKTVVAAMGQLFYSMSLAMGIMITYGSYMKKDVNIISATHNIEFFDTGIAFFAGLMIIPALFAFPGPDGAPMLDKGATLMFAILPKVFASMPGGQIVGALFFLLVLFAALTSSISLAETVISIFCDKFHWNRTFTCVVVLIGCLILGVPSSLGNGVWSGVKILGMDFLTFFDFISNNVIMPIVALLTCIFIGYFLKTQAIADEVELNGEFKGRKMFDIIIKFVAPVILVIILITSVLGAFIPSFNL